MGNKGQSFWELIGIYMIQFFIPGTISILLSIIFNLGAVWKSILAQLGGVMVVGGAINFWWKYKLKDEFKFDIINTTGFADEIRNTGLVGITRNLSFLTEIKWDNLFNGVCRLDLFVSYGRTWRSNFRLRLKELSHNENATVNIVLPNPYEDRILRELAIRFEMEKKEVEKFIKEAIQEYKEIFDDSKANFTLYLSGILPMYSYYIFDDTAVVALFKHRKEKGRVPSFTFKKGGQVYDNFIYKENGYILNKATEAKRVIEKHED